MKKFKRIPLNLQYFAEGDVDPEVDGIEIEVDDVKPTDKEEKQFTQADIDRIVKERLDRDRKKSEAKAEQEKAEAAKKLLEEQGEYKELLEATKAELEALKAEQEKRERDSSIKSSLKASGLTDEQVEAHFQWVEGSVKEDSDVEDVVKRYVDTLNITTNVDPSGGFGKTSKPGPKVDEDAGKDLLDRVKGLSKVKYN